MPAERLIIGSLGARGDGVAATPHGAVYVPLTLPGEEILAEIAGDRGSLVTLETAAPGRRTPECPLFGRCGGCAVQHVPEAAYRAWKRDLVVSALTKAGVTAPVGELIDAHGDGRRRVVFHARNVDGRVRVGFMAARSHTLVPIERCPVLAPGLADAPNVAERLAGFLHAAGKPLDIQATATLAGLDVDLRGHGPISDRRRLALVEAAAALDVARLSLHGDILVERRPPAIAMGAATVVSPPGGFLQATTAGEETLAGLVGEACDGAKRVADLFAGSGPFALRLAARAGVHAVESDAAALAALDRATRHTPKLKPITTERRDLFKRPLLPPELDRFEAVVFDPPRPGADAQARQIAASKVRVAVAVSCDPATFARDAAILIAGGFGPTRITPVDQFRYAHHVEVVGVFERAGAKRKR